MSRKFQAETSYQKNSKLSGKEDLLYSNTGKNTFDGKFPKIAMAFGRRFSCT